MTRPTGTEGQCFGVKTEGGNNRGRVWVNISISGIQTEALIDPGSTHTLISNNLYKKLPKLTPLYAGPNLQAANDSDMQVMGACTIKVVNTPLEVVVCSNMRGDMILGTNMFRLHNYLLIDYDRNTVRIGDHTYPARMCDRSYATTCNLSAIPKANHETINRLLRAYEDVFSAKDTPAGLADVPECEIFLKPNTEPIKQNARHYSYMQSDTVEKHVEQMLKDGVIRPSNSPWASPCLIVPKKDGSQRFCVNYKKLNASTVKDAYPLPKIREIFYQLNGATIFSTLDLKSAYWQLPMKEECIPMTAFTCHLGLYEFKRLPYGLTNAPGIFQRQMNKMLHGLIGKCCMVYLDDIVIFSRTEADHVRHIQLILQRIRESRLQLKPSKCHFGLAEIDLLGYRVSGAGIHSLPDKTSAIKNLGRPTSPKGVRSFLGMAGYYRTSIPNFADIAIPLVELTKKKSIFHWGTEHQQAFDTLKEALVSSSILAHPKTDEPYRLYTDASDYAIGAILVQEDEHGVERPISYLSHKLLGAEKNWATIEKEAYAVLYALKKYHMYLWGAKFEIHTDHKPLTSFFQSEIKNSKIQRWGAQIAEYCAPILYHKGKLNVRADMLSRINSDGQVSHMAPTQDQPMPGNKLPYCVPKDTGDEETEERIRPDILSHFKQKEQTYQPMPITDPPDVWKTDYIDHKELVPIQREQFQELYQEALSDNDGNCYIIESGVLYSLAEPTKGSGRYHRLVLPQQYRKQVIDRSHLEVGHSAQAKTLARIQEYYVWPGMRRHVREYISNCTHCNTLGPNKPPRTRGMMPTPPAPFHTWGMDLVGPFKRSVKGKEYLLTAVCHLTGWAEAIPIPNKSKGTIEQVFMTEIVSRYGIPHVLVTDGGGEFVNGPFRKFLAEYGIEHRITSPYHPQSNGMTERFNGTIQKLILKLSGGRANKWSEFVSEALLAYRACTGPARMSPYQAVFGQRPRLPRASPDGQEEGDRLASLLEATRTLEENRKETRQKYKDGTPRKARNLPPGTQVSIQVKNPTKGQPKWRPGFKVLSSHEGALRLVEESSGKIMRLNQERVREIPAEKGYDEIDPLPYRHRVAKPQVSKYEEAIPVPLPPKLNPHATTFVPVAAAVQSLQCTPITEPKRFSPYSKTNEVEWKQWLNKVYSIFHTADPPVPLTNTLSVSVTDAPIRPLDNPQ